MRSGNADILLDNWTGQGELYSLIEGSSEFSDQYKQVKQLVKDGGWDEQTLIRLFKPNMVEHIMDKVRPSTSVGNDVPVWTLEAQERFTKSRIPVDDHTEGINVQGLTFRNTVIVWWKVRDKRREQPYFQALPSFILWEIWKRRNKKKHDNKNTSALKLIHNITRNIILLLKVRKPNYDFSMEWPQILEELDRIKCKMRVKIVQWEMPEQGWVKYNIDGAFREAKEKSSYAYCLRDHTGG
ncbi:hypothetical protein FXO37_03138 [Capsicum annuum]|nr:hypothetical protein FXO37_03138 [Capsicum annuum]